MSTRWKSLAGVLACLFLWGCANTAGRTAEVVEQLEPEPKQAVSQRTAAPVETETPSPSPTARPTSTPVPRPTPSPTPTAEPAPQLDVGVLETRLRELGYKRYPFSDGNGGTAFFWDNGSGIVLYVYDSGFELSFLNDHSNLDGRRKLIDQSIDLVEPLFSSQFAEGLREEAHGYAGRVSSASGEAMILDYGQEPWLGKLLLFNGYETSIQNGSRRLPVYIRLTFREYKCDMSRYAYCYFYDMPTITFTGEASLTFFNIWVDFPSRQVLTQTS